MSVHSIAEYRVRKLLEKKTRDLLANDEEARGFWQLFRGEMCATLVKSDSFLSFSEPEKSA